MSYPNTEHMSSDQSDQRYFPRWEVNSPVSYCVGESKIFQQGNTKDISCAGACIISKTQILPHQKVRLVIQLTKATTVKLNGRVLWVKSDVEAPEMGVSFYDTTDEIQGSILQHAFEIDREQLLKQWYKGWENS